MSNVAKRPTRTPRRVREKRANQLVLIGGVSGAIAVIGFLLALFTPFPGWIVLVAAIVCAICVFQFRKMTSPR